MVLVKSLNERYEALRRSLDRAPNRCEALHEVIVTDTTPQAEHQPGAP